MNPIINPIHDVDALLANEGIRREIIDGELFVIRGRNWKHQNIITKISAVLHHWSETYYGVVILLLRISPSKEDSVIPDLIGISNERLAEIEVRPELPFRKHQEAYLPDEAGHFTSFPELVIEVRSPGECNIDRDKQAKLKFYSQGNG